MAEARLKCPDCGSYVSRAEITQDYEVIPVCDCRDAKKTKTVRRNPERNFTHIRARNSKKSAQHVADMLQCPVAVPLNLKKEAAMYKRFHHKKPDSIVRVSHPEIPKSLIALGKLESVIYKKDGMSYIHDLKKGILAADRKGKLFIIGDKAKITSRGILG